MESPIEDTMKECKACLEVKPKADSFYVRVSNRDGFDTLCKECHKFKRNGRKAVLTKEYKTRVEVMLEEVLGLVTPLLSRVDELHKEVASLKYELRRCKGSV